MICYRIVSVGGVVTKKKTIHHIISECSKLVQKENKSRHDRMEKVIHWELCKKVNYDDTNKSNWYKSEFILENETYNFFLILGYKQFT